MYEQLLKRPLEDEFEKDDVLNTLLDILIILERDQVKDPNFLVYNMLSNLYDNIKDVTFPVYEGPEYEERYDI